MLKQIAHLMDNQLLKNFKVFGKNRNNFNKNKIIRNYNNNKYSLQIKIQIMI